MRVWLGQMSKLSGTGGGGLREEKDKWINAASKGRAYSDLTSHLQIGKCLWLVRKEGGRQNPQTSEGQPVPPGEGLRKEGSPWGRIECWQKGLLPQRLQGGRGLRRAMGGLQGPVCRGTLTPCLAGSGWQDPAGHQGWNSCLPTAALTEALPWLPLWTLAPPQGGCGPDSCAGNDLPGSQ